MTRPEERILYGARRPDGSTPFWRMPTIWAMAEGKSPTSVAIEDLNILDEVVWFGGPKNVQPTVRRIAQRARDILDAGERCQLLQALVAVTGDRIAKVDA